MLKSCRLLAFVVSIVVGAALLTGCSSTNTGGQSAQEGQDAAAQATEMAPGITTASDNRDKLKEDLSPKLQEVNEMFAQIKQSGDKKTIAKFQKFYEKVQENYGKICVAPATDKERKQFAAQFKKNYKKAKKLCKSQND